MIPMIAIWREGESGNRQEHDGSVLAIEFGLTVANAVFDEKELECEFGRLNSDGVAGFRPETLFRIIPITLEAVELGLDRHLGIELDENGNVHLGLSPRAGEGLNPKRYARYPVVEICDHPHRFSDRGIQALLVGGLSQIEIERHKRAGER